jgi:hypothetical protein
MRESSVQDCGLQDQLIIMSVIFICRAVLKGKCTEQPSNVTVFITVDELQRVLREFLPPCEACLRVEVISFNPV